MPHPRLATMLRDAAHDCARGRRDRHQHPMYFASTEKSGEVGDRAQHLCPRDPSPLLARVVIHEPEPRHPAACAALDLLEESDTGASRPDDEDERVDAPYLGARVALPDDPHAHANAGHDDGADDEVDHEDGT